MSLQDWMPGPDGHAFGVDRDAPSFIERPRFVPRQTLWQKLRRAFGSAWQGWIDGWTWNE